MIEATPRKDFHPTQPHADILSKIKGKVWIDKNDYSWVKMDAEVIDTISLGWFLARIHKGTVISIDQTRVNDEIWLPQKIFLNASARLMVFLNGGIEQESTYSKYRKFSTATKILPGVSEVEQPK